MSLYSYTFYKILFLLFLTIIPCSTVVGQEVNLKSSSLQQGVKALEENNYSSAISLIEQWIENHPDDPAGYWYQGIFYEKIGRPKLAQSSFSKALHLDPSFPFQLKHTTNSANYRIDSIPEGFQDLENLNFHIEKGYLSYIQENYFNAIDELNLAIEMDSLAMEAWYYRGRANMKIKRWEEATYDLSQALFIGGPNADVFLARGQVRYQTNQLKDALRDFELSIHYDSADASGYYHRGITLQRLGKITQACQDLIKAKTMGMLEAKEVCEIICRTY